jgi:hypothetical protein
MPPKTRAVRAAEELLDTLTVRRLPVRIDEIARKHAFVMRDPLPPDVSGMLIPAADNSKKSWIIIVNKKHSLERQRFTMAHELAHLVLHEYKTPHADGTQRVRFRDASSSLGTDREEVEANQFAAEILMPATLLIPRLRELGLDSWDGELSDTVSDALVGLARECRVSEQALLFRIANLLQPG